VRCVYVIDRLPELQGDVIAGLTVGMTVIPQAIAYADIAGVPAQVGIGTYSKYGYRV